MMERDQRTGKDATRPKNVGKTAGDAGNPAADMGENMGAGAAARPVDAAGSATRRPRVPGQSGAGGTEEAVIGVRAEGGARTDTDSNVDAGTTVDTADLIREME